MEPMAALAVQPEVDQLDLAWAVASGGEAVRPSLLVESILFVADRPVALTELMHVLGLGKAEVERALTELARVCDARGVRLQRDDGQVQLVSAPEAAEAIQRFLGLEASTRLSPAALETLSIIAYRQPMTRPEIEALRGVNSEAVLRTLLARGLIAAVGRRDSVGHPVEHGTTFQFLEYFGLASLGDLPPLASLEDAQVDMAADPPADTATAPPDGSVAVTSAGALADGAAGAAPGASVEHRPDGHGGRHRNGRANGHAAVAASIG